MFRFQWMRIRNYKKNKLFKKTYPQVALPSDYLIYESFQLDYHKYYLDSRETAVWVKRHIEKYNSLENKKILDWGCGPGRIIRHLPEVVGNNCAFFGTDYNNESIEWCRKHIPGVSFNLNGLEAKLPWPENTFDAIYGISIFTHLSEKMHFDWLKELVRILKPASAGGGILFFTTQGSNFRVKLSASEQNLFDKGQLIVRGNVKEGHRTFSAFQPQTFMLHLLKDVDILEHIEPESHNASIPAQDIWIVRKR